MSTATYGTLAAEFALGILIWIRELRSPLIIVGLLMHVGMEYALNLQLFSWLMCVGLLSFVDPYWVIGQLSVVSGPLSGQLAATIPAPVHSIVETLPGYWVVNTFIGVYLFYCYTWTAPDNTAFKPFLKLIRPVVRYLGLWHSWSMFAPTLFSVTRNLEVRIQFDDGGETIWTPDYAPGMTRYQRFRRERFRKLTENCRDGEFGYVRWCLCEYVIRQYRSEAGNDRQIRQVLIYHVEEPIVDFQTKPDADLSIKRHLHYTYVVK